MIISVASGKGGTGKTTIATNLAVSMDQPVQLVDCDVEEPNAHIFMKPQITLRLAVNKMVPSVDMELCDLCEACGKICQFSAITVIGKKVLTFPDMCHSCKGCMMVCPNGAITESPLEIGVIEKGRSGFVEFIHGCLKVGQPMSAFLINKIKEDFTSDKITIIDAPPGTSCPMISAIKGSDFVLLVTEPTPFGLNDLVLAVKTVRALKIPCGIVINRCDVGDMKTHEFAEKEEIPILMETPDSRQIAEAYSRGEMIIERVPGMKNAFRELFKRIIREVRK